MGAERTLTIDAGDTIQGTPLAYYFAKIDPITGGSTHPMAAAMNQVGYDAAALGNHEFNYGLDTLRAFEKQCNFPLLSANSVDWNTGAPVFKPWIIKTIKLPDTKSIKVGILGLVTPGVAIWDAANVEGKVRFPGIVEQAKVMVPRLKAAGADVVIVVVPLRRQRRLVLGRRPALRRERERPARRAGPRHRRDPRRPRPPRDPAAPRDQHRDRQAGAALRAPLLGHARDPDVARRAEGPRAVAGRALRGRRSTTPTPRPRTPPSTGAVAASHAKVLTYVNSVIGTSTQAMSAATSRYEDTAAMDFINYVQADAVKAALVGTPQAGLPVLSIAAPFNKAAAIPEGDVTVRDVAGLYIYDNTLLGIVLTGAQVKDYLEQSACVLQAARGDRARTRPTR